MPIMNRSWYLREATRLRARADEMERIAAKAKPDKPDERDKAERYVCAGCGFIGYGAWNCDACGKHELIRR